MQKIGQPEYAQSRDEELVRAFQEGNADVFSELVARYLKLVRIKACSFREIFSLEREDLYQEGLLGLFDAANSYTEDGGASFETYAGRCISNRIVSAVRRSSSRKNSFLNHAIPIEEVEAVGADDTSDPQALLESRDEMDRMLDTVHISLSPFERKVLSFYLGGYKRSEVEGRLGISARAFDNAMARVRKKLRQK
ncbi:MAG: sigma-70 family RNA polymerase sigma factor [Hominenteromicrobium sp.]